MDCQRLRNRKLRAVVNQMLVDRKENNDINGCLQQEIFNEMGGYEIALLLPVIK